MDVQREDAAEGYCRVCDALLPLDADKRVAEHPNNGDRCEGSSWPCAVIRFSQEAPEDGRCSAVHPDYEQRTPPQRDTLPDGGRCVFDTDHDGHHEAHPDMPWSRHIGRHIEAES